MKSQSIRNIWNQNWTENNSVEGLQEIKNQKFANKIAAETIDPISVVVVTLQIQSI